MALAYFTEFAWDINLYKIGNEKYFIPIIKFQKNLIN